MKTEKNYTPAQLREADTFAQALKEIPDKDRGLVIMMANSFLAGIEAGRQMLQKETA